MTRSSGLSEYLRKAKYHALQESLTKFTGSYAKNSCHTLAQFRSTFSLRWYPEEWKHFKTVVLRKPERPDYRLAKAYRSIALLDNLGKILSTCVAEHLVFETERLKLLPEEQFGGRPGRSTTDRMHGGNGK